MKTQTRNNKLRITADYRFLFVSINKRVLLRLIKSI